MYTESILFNQECQFVTQLDPVDMGDYIFVGLAVKGADVGDPPDNASDQEKKAYKIMQASKECEKRIFAGFDSLCLGKSKHFDSTANDQASINGLATVAMAGIIGITTEETHWKASGELECYKFEYAQVMALALDLKRHVESNIAQFNAERLAILNA